MNVKKVILMDLRDIGPNLYDPGEMIVSDLNELGWIVARGDRIITPTNEKIIEIPKKGSGTEVTWYSIDAQVSSCRM